MFRMAIESALMRGEFRIITNESELNESAQGIESLRESSQCLV